MKKCKNIYVKKKRKLNKTYNYLTQCNYASKYIILCIQIMHSRHNIEHEMYIILYSTRKFITSQNYKIKKIK